MSLINSGLDCLLCAVRICSRSLHVDGQLVQFHRRRLLSPPNGLDTFVKIQPTLSVWTLNSILLTDRSVPTVPCCYVPALTTVQHAGNSIHPRTPHRITNPTKESSTSHFSASPFQLLHPPPPHEHQHAAATQSCQTQEGVFTCLCPWPVLSIHQWTPHLFCPQKAHQSRPS